MRLFVMALFLVFLCVNIPAQTNVHRVTLGWCPSSDTNVAGYKVYYGNTPATNWQPAIYSWDTDPCVLTFVSGGSNYSRSYNKVAEAGNLCSVVITNLIEGETYYFAAVAYDYMGLESDFSEELRVTISTNSNTNIISPADLRIRGVR